MNPDFFHINFAGMDEIAQSLRGYVNQLQGEQDQMRTVHNTMSSQWAGPAQASYAVADARLSAVLNEMNTVLNMMGTHVQTANGNWQATEQNNVRRMTVM